MDVDNGVCSLFVYGSFCLCLSARLMRVLSTLSCHLSFLEELDSSPVGGEEDGTSGRCRAASLATMAWALSHTKHKRKFVEANKGSLLRLAAECEGRCEAIEGCWPSAEP